ncbi:efflux RND transporter permease subunit [Sphingomonas sp. PR090111-T3T-6A]|uniref:efflux RND transporter permease subunit n=1 Tax=Sphingomonas sp. PR090111-T3T-6A TaxID=685778 RepID=UPI000365705C|nr:multidrug efflux RND transporter permease subunit [Sphingomonas sp. PR090111-T3T-6A]
MRFPHFFIERPIFAAVLAIMITVAGLVAYPSLPVGQYPEVAPPTVVVTARFPGATAETMASTVAVPLEQQINGVEHMLYMSTSSVGEGSVTITVTFALGTDVNEAQVLVQNRVDEALPRLPDETRQIGVTVRKVSAEDLVGFAFYSPDNSLDTDFISNYVTLQINDRIKRLPGVGDTVRFGGRDYAMRIWIDPDLAAIRNLTVDEIVTAIRAQNAQVAAGIIGQPPYGVKANAFQLGVDTEGRLATPEQFGNIILKRRTDGGLTRLRDVARVELGAQDYSTNAFLNDRNAIGLVLKQQPGTNALATAERAKALVAELSKDFPQGMAYSVAHHPLDFVSDSIRDVKETLFVALLLVSSIVLLFLQSWRAAIIPLIAIPISLTGGFATMAAFGFSLNSLSLFGMVLAIGIVVDDAIVVVENIERLIAEENLTPKDAAHQTMTEVSGALVAIALVLCGVFLPTAFIPGLSGEFYKQFALTIVSATVVSAFISLTLSPALAALLLKPAGQRPEPKRGILGFPSRFARWFNHLFDRLSVHYGRLTGKLVRRLVILSLVYGLLIFTTGWRFYVTPQGFIPSQDQDLLINVLQLPPGSSLQRTTEISKQVQAAARTVPEVDHALTFAGFDGATYTSASNTALIATHLKPQSKRSATIDEVADKLRKAYSGITGANVLVISPPPVRSIGLASGFKMELEDRTGLGYTALEKAAQDVIAEANKDPALRRVFTTYNTGTPRLHVSIDREKAEQLGVPVDRVFSTLSTYLGSAYINDFNYLGRTWQVVAQADTSYRQSAADILQLRARSESGKMVPLGAIADVQKQSGPYRVVRYNLFPSAEIQGEAAPGYSSGQALEAMERISARVLPKGMGIEWTDLSFQQKQAGNTGIYVFGLAVLFVFLLLAAQYESVVLPLAVILIVPMCLLAAILGINLLGMDNNVLTQIGLVVLIGLAAKNAILIVEFARQGEAEGLNHWEAATRAAHQRLRPILMTSIAFILGVFPLIVAHGAGSEMRKALGVAVFFGMIGVTFFGLIFTPSFYVINRIMAEWIDRRVKRLRSRFGGHAVGHPGATPGDAA